MRRLAARICLQRPAGETNHRLANNQFFHRLFVGEVYELGCGQQLRCVYRGDIFSS
jgi:hypothetical protein